MAIVNPTVKSFLLPILVFAHIGIVGLAASPKSAAPSDIPSMVFTLPPSSKVRPPQPIRNMVMYCIKMSPEQEAVWRDEYKNIRNDKAALIEWLDGKIDDTLRNEYMFILQQFKDASAKGDQNEVNFWVNKMGGWKEEDRFKWLQSYTVKRDNWHAYVLHGW